MIIVGIIGVIFLIGLTILLELVYNHYAHIMDDILRSQGLKYFHYKVIHNFLTALFVSLMMVKGFRTIDTDQVILDLENNRKEGGQ